ncbi:MAG TPA: anthranilate phosphoribosyltransferase [Acidimicrobiia bacterium]|nr:anthranilate phosphoribosyltransferase [Acidimicrobiia bacterium]
MDWPATLSRLSSRVDLSRDEARLAMEAVMNGEATSAQIAALIVAWRMKGETTDEMTGMTEAIRAAAVPIQGHLDRDRLVDLVGTGGDRAGTFNISTAAALVAAGAGARIAKHGNRSVSSRCGSADVLEGLGVAIDLPLEANLTLLEENNFAFFYAPLYHPSFRHAGPVRRELGIRTVFNFLGPLANPAGARRQAVGVSDPVMAERMIGVLERLGSIYSFVFCGVGGIDEIVPTGPTLIHRLKDGELTQAEFTPEDFGVGRATIEQLAGGGVEENVMILRSVLDGEEGPRRDAVLVNASPALVAAELAPGFVEAVDLARRSIDSGAARAVLDRTVERSQELARA